MISPHLGRTLRRGLIFRAVVLSFQLGRPIPAQAVPLPTVSLSTASDLSSLSLGDVVTIDVVLSGLLLGDELEYLSAAIDTQLFMPLASPTAGPIADPLNFTGASLPGGVDGFFDSFFGLNPGANITSDGIFYSFSLKAATLGSGEISISSALVAIDLDPMLPDFADPTATGDPLQFTIIPEPGALSLLAIGCLCLGLWRASLRRALAAC